MRARMYDPRTGRFTQNDPIAGNRPWDHYLYASNNPVSRIDPMGTQDEDTHTLTFKDGRWGTPTAQELLRERQLMWAKRHEIDAKDPRLSQMQRQSHQRMADALRQRDMQAYMREAEGNMQLLGVDSRTA